MYKSPKICYGIKDLKLHYICPECGISVEDTPHYVSGIQYCCGDVDRINDNGTVTIDDLGSGDYTVDPYEICCGECGHVLWSKEIMVNEEKFFQK